MRVRRQAGIVDVLHLRVRAQERGERHPVGVVRLHPDRQRLGPAQHQERVERAQDRALRVLHEPQPLDVLVTHGDDDAADAVAVAVEVFRRAVRDQVGAELDRPLDVRAGERVVDDQLGVMAMGEVGRGAEIRQPHHRIGRRLDEQHLGRRRHRPLDLVEVRGVDVGERELVAPQHLVEQPEGAAVGVVGDDHVVARLEHRRDRADRGHARGEGEPFLAGLDRCEVALERHPRRVLRPGILVALVFTQRLLDVGRGLVDRRDDRTGRGVRLLAGVEANGAETRAGCELHDPTTIT